MVERYHLNVPGAKHLYVNLGRPKFVERVAIDFVGKHALETGTIIRLAQVVDPRHKLYLRRYAYVVNGMTLRVCSPCHSGVWPQMDSWVSRALGNASVLTYEIAALGALVLQRTA